MLKGALGSMNGAQPFTSETAWYMTFADWGWNVPDQLYRRLRLQADVCGGLGFGHAWPPAVSRKTNSG